MASPLGNDDILSMIKAAEYEVIHGRWAMLAIPGIVAQEQATGIPWYETGALCTPASCLENYTFPGAPAPLAPEGSGLPSFYAVVAFQVVLMGLAEAYERDDVERLLVRRPEVDLGREARVARLRPAPRPSARA